MNTAEAIAELYQAFLGRGPDPAGLALHCSMWEQEGGPLAVVGSLAFNEERSVRLRRVQSGALDDRVGVVHIPKCAGSTVRVAASHLPGMYVGPGYFERSGLDLPVSTANHETQLTVGEWSRIFTDHWGVMGHLSVRTLIEAGANRIFLTVREPRVRLLSLYRFWESLSPSAIAAMGDWGNTLSRAVQGGFSRFVLDDDVREAVDNAMLHQITGLRRELRWCSADDEDVSVLLPFVTRAYWPEESEGLVADLVELAGLPQPQTINQFENRTPSGGRWQRIGKAGMQALDAKTSLDSQLLQTLMETGVLSYRSQDAMDAEFQTALRHHRFEV